MDWVAAEVPEDVLRGRIAQVAAACGAQGLDAALFYSSFTRPAQVSALTHFVPFWSQALLAVTPTGVSLLAMATTGRTVQWIRSVSRVDEVIVGAEVGASAGQWLRANTPARRIAIAAPDDMPCAAHAGLRKALPDTVFEPAGGALAALEAGFDPTPRVRETAHSIAGLALARVSSQHWQEPHALLAALDGHCRSLGAEEVSVQLAPDLAHGALAYRLEGPAALGAHFGLRLTLAYKGYWLRVGSSFTRNGMATQEHPACIAALNALRAVAARTRRIGEWVHAVRQASGALVTDWQVEARQCGLPLASISASDHIGAVDAPACASFSARLAASGTPLILGTFL
jgi:hypothetical protein